MARLDSINHFRTSLPLIIAISVLWLASLHLVHSAFCPLVIYGKLSSAFITGRTARLALLLMQLAASSASRSKGMLCFFALLNGAAVLGLLKTVSPYTSLLFSASKVSVECAALFAHLKRTVCALISIDMAGRGSIGRRTDPANVDGLYSRAMFIGHFEEWWQY